MGTDIHICPASVTDAPSITACVDAAYRHYESRLGKPPGPMSVDYAEVIKQHEVFVAVSEGRIVGILVLIRRLETMLLDNVAVHPDFQGQGLGRRLIALAESETKRLRYDEIQLYTNEKMVENIALYSRLGYVEIGRRSEQGLQRVYMSKRLAD